MDLIEIGRRAKAASKVLRTMSTAKKNEILSKAAMALIENADEIISANKKDVEFSRASGIGETMIDRLILDNKRIEQMADGLRKVSELDDPVGETDFMKTLQNGLVVGRKSVPFGVIGMIYEARPNVTSDAFGLCFKAGSAVILRGGKDAINSNIAIVSVFRRLLDDCGIDNGCVQLIEDTSRETATRFMKLYEYVDVLIPRGGAGLIKSVVENSQIPVIETGTGNCHIFVDESADPEKAISIIINAKVQRPSVCNACEKVIIHEKIADSFLPKLYDELKQNGVEVRGDEKAKSICGGIISATEEDWGTEYLDLVIAIKMVKNIEEAIVHIDKYSTGHSDAILTESYTNSQKFLNEVDSACVYVNASTRFTDGEMFGFGAEIGISTQKLHARGPMGLKEMTSYKYIVYGNGHVRR